MLVSNQSLYFLTDKSLYLFKKFRCIVNLKKLSKKYGITDPIDYCSLIFDDQLFIIGGQFMYDKQWCLSNKVLKINLQTHRT